VELKLNFVVESSSEEEGDDEDVALVGLAGYVV
jgi:hypothetical protein